MMRCWHRYKAFGYLQPVWLSRSQFWLLSTGRWEADVRLRKTPLQNWVIYSNETLRPSWHYQILNADSLKWRHYSSKMADGRYLHRRTQDFTMEGFAWYGPGKGIWWTEVPQWVQGQSPGWGSGGRNPREAEAKCEISLQFLTFSCVRFWIVWTLEQGLESIFCKHTIQFF